jgi:hypothetical protein
VEAKFTWARTLDRSSSDLPRARNSVVAGWNPARYDRKSPGNPEVAGNNPATGRDRDRAFQPPSRRAASPSTVA